jgi:hypothetical protein
MSQRLIYEKLDNNGSIGTLLFKDHVTISIIDPSYVHESNYKFGNKDSGCLNPNALD